MAFSDRLPANLEGHREPADRTAIDGKPLEELRRPALLRILQPQEAPPLGSIGRLDHFHLPAVVPRRRDIRPGEQLLEAAVADRRSRPVGLHDPRLLGLAGHRHKQARHERLAHHLTVTFREQNEHLVVPLADRDHHPPPFGQLFDERLGDLLGGTGDDDLVERSMLRPPLEAVANLRDDVLVAEPGEDPRGLLAEWLVDLDRVDRLHQRRQHRRLVAAAGADLEDTIGGPWLEPLGHVGDHERTRDRLLLADRQGHVDVGEMTLRRGDELVPRGRPQALEHAGIGDATGRNVLEGHPLPQPPHPFGGGIRGRGAGRDHREHHHHSYHSRRRSLHGPPVPVSPGPHRPHHFAAFDPDSIPINSISKTSASPGSITGSEPSSPYPRSGGTHSRHFDPTVISGSASCQPGITC